MAIENKEIAIELLKKDGFKLKEIEKKLMKDQLLILMVLDTNNTQF